ncbi:MAG: hypothetical protein CMM50_17555 [Rhodospirillaceae bacterium]|nr:hypothetical protein [Rhodospirillaceae bacterium]
MFGPVKPRFVLVVGDEGALLACVAGRRVVDVHFAAAGDRTAEEAVCGVLGHAGGAPVTVLLDTQEQVYRQEMLPALGPLDRRKLMARRLKREMAGLVVGGVMLLRPSPLGRPDGYLLAGAVGGPAIDGWLARLDGLPNPLSGIGLLPLEAAGMTGRLRPPTPVTGGCLWTVLIVRNRVSGLRQIVVRDGTFVLTRLTAATDSAPLDGEVLATAFEETRGYLARSGLERGDNVAVVILAGPDDSRGLKTMPLAADSITVMTPEKAAGRLGLTLPDGDGEVADMLHAAYAAQHSMELPLSRPEEGQLSAARRLLQPRTVNRIAATGLVASLGWAAVSFANLDAERKTVETLQDRNVAAQSALSEARSGADDLPESPERMVALIDAWRTADPNLDAIEALWDMLAEALAGDGHARRVSWESDETGGGMLEFLVRLSAPEGDERSAGETAEHIAARLKLAFPDHLVSMVHGASVLPDSGTLKGEVGSDVAPPPRVEPVFEFRIAGPGDSS